MVRRHHAVLAAVSSCCSAPRGTFPRVTHPSAAPPEGSARLACVKPAASVRSEPGSNSQVERRRPSPVLPLAALAARGRLRPSRKHAPPSDMARAEPLLDVRTFAHLVIHSMRPDHECDQSHQAMKLTRRHRDQGPSGARYAQVRHAVTRPTTRISLLAFHTVKERAGSVPGNNRRRNRHRPAAGERRI